MTNVSYYAASDASVERCIYWVAVKWMDACDWSNNATNKYYVYSAWLTSFIGLQRDSPPHETFSDLQQRYN